MSQVIEYITHIYEYIIIPIDVLYPIPIYYTRLLFTMTALRQSEH